MKSRQIALAGILLISIVVAAVVSGCTPSMPRSSGQIIKVGMLTWLGFPMGLDMVNTCEVMVDQDNKAGGLSIGGQKYNIRLVNYDVKNDKAAATAAANRLLFEDKVKFILSDGILLDVYMPLTEQNKVLLSAITPSDKIFNPDYKYSYMPCFNWSMQSSGIGWLTKNFPLSKSVLVAYPNAVSGREQQPAVKAACTAFGLKYNEEFYPVNSQDLASLAARVKTVNPDVFIAVGGGPVSDAIAYKAVVQSGYKGLLFATTTIPFETLSQIVPADGLEAFTGTAWPVEFNPATTQPARDFKAAYNARYGKWEGPEIQGGAAYSFLRAALMQAGSIDPEKVASDISSYGLKYDGPFGEGQMIQRPDKKNNRYVDSIIALLVKEVIRRKAVQIDTINMGMTFDYFKQVYK